MDREAGLIELTGGGRALRQEDLIQLIDDPDLAPLPRSGGAWVGLANLRGEVIPVADLALLSGGERLGGSVLAALRAGDRTFGLLIEGVERTVERPAAGELADDPLPDDPEWLLPAPPGEPRVIDTSLLLEDRLLGAGA